MGSYASSYAHNEELHLDAHEKVQQIVGFGGKLVWDSNKPDGTMRKLLNVDKLHSLGWKESISLDDGISAIYQDYQK